MPNTGKPSPNCHLCRQRRVKCDLARPQCQRCVKYGVQCPGYRDDQDLRFQHTDAVSFGHRRGKRQQQIHPPSSPGALEVIALTPESTASPVSSQESGSPGYQSAGTPPLPVPRSVRQHWTAESIPLVIGLYSSLDFLPKLFKDVRQDHCLVLASHVFTRAYVINRFRPRMDQRELSVCLGNALASVQEAVKSPKVYAADSTIVAVWLLGNYEASLL
ncbi:beauvericin cluster-specific repressor BEA4 [Colletotrichum spaethianum]|uniref:Beauvericin cluster-specific repressor BEA4 n=1 Tax=Colletotrichum spaethianum TaxID=700344 RepID=A0AA37P9L3_9PEZI|nr:beauvericin cluster-specific repressor BEA4 [Colletotrichum spaethianum]GKT48145.1 beauvericin cluster-specific repressor BEA4 [Colletotrichum spaethianum]